MKPTYFFLACSLLPTSMVYAGAMGPVTDTQPFFIEIGSGISFANQATPSVNLTYWNSSIQGYNSSLGYKPLYTAGLGYKINPGINIDLNYTFRGLYSYSKFQTSTSTSSNSVENVLPSRTRYMDLSSNAVLFNVTLDGGIYPALVYTMGHHGTIQPFVGAGIGASYNSVSNFHTILASTSATQSIATSNMADQTQTSFAYQFNGGLEWEYERFAFDVGYRYFNAGPYTSNSYLVTNMDGTTGAPETTYSLPAWTGTLSANEIFFTAKVAF